VEAAGLAGVSLSRIDATIEDAFMWYMGQEQAA
jgi:hypothetical protein